MMNLIKLVSIDLFLCAFSKILIVKKALFQISVCFLILF